jgi:hypothetical protein
MTSILLIVALNIAFVGWVLWLMARDPANIFKRRPSNPDKPDPDAKP